MRTAFARGWRQLRSDGRRYLIAVVALGFGVALLFGTLLTSQSIRQQLQAGVSSLGGIGDVGLVPADGATYLDASNAAAVARLPGVDSSIGTLTIDSTISSATNPALTLSVTGYPTAFNPRLAGLVDDGRLPSAGADEVLVPTDLAGKLGVRVGDVITVASHAGASRLTVIGTVDPERLGALAYDNVFVDLDTARTLFDLPGELTRIDVILTPGYGVERWQTEAPAELPAGVQLQDTTALTSTFGPLLSIITLVLLAAGAVTVAVAAMLAASAFDGAVRARQQTYGVMRAVGATGRWLAQGVLVEALLLSLIAAAVGLAVGLAVSLGLTRVLTAVGDLPNSPLQVQPWAVVVAVIVAVLAGLTGAGRAIHAVLRQPPLASLALQPVAPARRVGPGVVVGAVLTLAGLGTGLVQVQAVQLISFALLLAAAAALAPGALVLVARVVRVRSWPIALASSRLRRLRTQGVVVAIATVVVALSASLTVGVSAIGTALQTQLAKQFGADVQISSPVVVGDAVEQRVAGLPGVAHVTGTVTEVGTLRAGSTENDVSLLAVDPTSYFQTSQLPWRQGDDDTTPAALRADATAAVLPASLIDTDGLRMGDHVELSRGDRQVELTVVGSYASLSTGTQVVVSREVGHRLGVDGYTDWNVAAAPGVSPDALRDAVAAALSDIPGLDVITAADMRDRATAQLASYAGAAFGIVVVGLVLGAVGTGGLLALGTAQREREIGILRAIGARRRQIRQLITGEVIMVALTAAVLGLAIGQVGGLVLTKIIARALGATLDVAVAPLPFLGIAALSSAALLIAAILPSRRASRVDPVVALAAE